MCVIITQGSPHVTDRHSLDSISLPLVKRAPQRTTFLGTSDWCALWIRRENARLVDNFHLRPSPRSRSCIRQLSERPPIIESVCPGAFGWGLVNSFSFFLYAMYVCVCVVGAAYLFLSLPSRAVLFLSLFVLFVFFPFSSSFNSLEMSLIGRRRLLGDQGGKENERGE